MNAAEPFLRRWYWNVKISVNLSVGLFVGKIFKSIYSSNSRNVSFFLRGIIKKAYFWTSAKLYCKGGWGGVQALNWKTFFINFFVVNKFFYQISYEKLRDNAIFFNLTYSSLLSVVFVATKLLALCLSRDKSLLDRSLLTIRISMESTPLSSLSMTAANNQNDRLGFSSLSFVSDGIYLRFKYYNGGILCWLADS